MPVSAEVLVAGALSPEEAAELIADFDAMGFTIALREVPPRRSIGDIAWLALIAVPAKPFFEQLAKTFADDAYRHLKTLVGKVGTVLHRDKTFTGAPKVLVLQDSTTGVQVILESDLPDEAPSATVELRPVHHPTRPAALRPPQPAMALRTRRSREHPSAKLKLSLPRTATGHRPKPIPSGHFDQDHDM